MEASATSGPPAAAERRVGPPHPAEAALRRRLGWFLLIRLGLVTAFLGFAALLYTRPQTSPLAADPRLGLIALGYGVTAISGLLLPRARRLARFAGVQVAVDLALVSLVIVLTGGLESPLAVLYDLVVLNAALLLLGRGVLVTAAAAAATYAFLLAGLAAGAAEPIPLARLAVGAGTTVASFFAIAWLARYLATELARAEVLLAERGEELRRIEALQRLVATSIDNGLVVTDLGGRVLSVSPTAAEILGLDAAAVAGAPLAALVPALAAHDGADAEFPLGEDGEARRVVRVKRAVVTDSFETAVARMYVVQDLTTVRDMEARLREQERMEAYASAVQPLADGGVTELEGMVGASEPMRRVFALIERVAPTDSTVLVTGESGTGKELVARALHRRSPRAGKDFVVVNCGAIPETLIESELFGHVRGAFTGAVADRPGLFRQAHGGTIFLDEIGELPLAMQVRLLRVLQDRRVQPVGGSHSGPVDVRVVAATNRDLERLVAEGKFREDLYYRLNVIRIETPPLRTRPEDIPLLLVHLLRACSARHGKQVERVSPRTMRLLVSHAYPGNIRELENVVDHAVTLCDGDTLTEQDLPAAITSRPDAPAPAPQPPAPEPGAPGPLLTAGRSLDDQLAQYEREMLLAALDRACGVRKRAAELLGIKYRSLRHRLAKYGIASAEDEDLDLGHGPAS